MPIKPIIQKFFSIFTAVFSMLVIAIGNFMRWISPIKFSFIAFLVALSLGLLSMGILGASLYYTVLPILAMQFPPLSTWHGDWVWPAMISAGMLWSFGFLIAGVANHNLLKQNTSKHLRQLIYIIILWLWAFIIWQLILNSVFQ
jgi:hypothetical protein